MDCVWTLLTDVAKPQHLPPKCKAPTTEEIQALQNPKRKEVLKLVSEIGVVGCCPTRSIRFQEEGFQGCVSCSFLRVSTLCVDSGSLAFGVIVPVCSLGLSLLQWDSGVRQSWIKPQGELTLVHQPCVVMFRGLDHKLPQGWVKFPTWKVMCKAHCFITGYLSRLSGVPSLEGSV